MFFTGVVPPGFTQMVVSLWAVTILSLYIKVQVNILGRHLYIDTARGLGSSLLLVRSILSLFPCLIFMLIHNHHLSELLVFLQATFVKFHLHLSRAIISDSCSLVS
jgi:hypothetical protein